MDCTKNESKDETPTAHKPTKKLSPSQSSPDNPSAAPQGIPQQAPSVHSVVIRPTPVSSSTPQKRCHSKPNGVEYLLNPTAVVTSAGGRQHNGDGTDFPWIAPIAATSRPATPPPASMKKRPSGDITLPSITPALMNLHNPLSRSTTPRSPTSHEPYLIRSSPPNATINAQQPPAVFPRDQASALTGSGPLLSEIVMAPSMP